MEAEDRRSDTPSPLPHSRTAPPRSASQWAASPSTQVSSYGLRRVWLCRVWGPDVPRHHAIPDPNSEPLDPGPDLDDDFFLYTLTRAAAKSAESASESTGATQRGEGEDAGSDSEPEAYTFSGGTGGLA